MGEIKVEVPEGLPLNDLKEKIQKLIKEEEAKLIAPEGSMDKEISGKKKPEKQKNINAPLQKDARKKVLDKYYGVIVLDRTVSIEEILDLEEEPWQY